jgi:hypothetical protein
MRLWSTHVTACQYDVLPLPEAAWLMTVNTVYSGAPGPSLHVWKKNIIVALNGAAWNLLRKEVRLPLVYRTTAPIIPIHAKFT